MGISKKKLYDLELEDKEQMIHTGEEQNNGCKLELTKQICD